jgi:OOP family OmpA-OmpF porin
MRKTIVSSVVSLCMMALAVPAFAGVKAETFSVSPFIGGYTFDGMQHVETRPEYGIRGGYNFTDHFGVEAVLGFVATEFTKNGGNGDVNLFNYRLDALYHFMPENRLVPYVAAGFGGLTANLPHQKDRTRGAFNYGAGLKYFLTDSLALRGDVRNLVFNESIANENHKLFNYEYNAGVDFVFGGAKPAPAPVIEPPPAPAPAPPAAPSAKLNANPTSVTMGQGTTLNWSSQNATNCVIQPGIGPVPTAGSKSVTPSRDTDYTLVCDGAGGQATSLAAVNVVQPPPPAPVAAPAPAPKPVPVPAPAPAMEKLTIKLAVEFDNDKAVIKPEYHQEIGKVAEFLQKYPTVNGVIEGHTDNVGNAAYNLKLSQRRADSVRKYLVEKYNIAPERLTAKGYGMTRPVASNKTAQGRHENRRVQATFDTVVVKK